VDSKRRANRLPVIFAGLAAAVLLLALGIGNAAEPLSGAALRERVAAGDRLFQAGDFERALNEWDQALKSYNPDTQRMERSDVLSKIADAFRALGYTERAAVTLQQAAQLSASDDVRTASILSNLGSALQAAGLLKEARQQIDTSIVLAQKTGRRDIEAAAQNNRGNLLAAANENDAAISAYQRSIDLAAQSGNSLLRSQALVNAARTAERTGKPDQAVALAQAAGEAATGLPPSHDSAYALIAGGQLYLRLQKATPSQSLLDAAVRALNGALKMAREIGDRRAESYALGYLGELYENEGRVADALDLTRRATFDAQQLNAPELLYRWNWQTGRLLRAQNDPDGAIAAYRQAVGQLQSIRNDVLVNYTSGRSSFREVFAPLYFELADLLLQQGANTKDPSRVQQALVEARDTIERSKSAELQDYFQDNCVTALQSKITQVEKVGARTAVIYPILLRDRLELLVTFSDSMRQYRVAVDGASLVEAVRNFRLRLERRTSREYLPLAQQLYGWLVKPFEPELVSRKIDTLVFVPDGALRTIPISALHDGKQYLISRFAVATTPGLTLVDPRPLEAHASQVLLSGLTEPVQGFSGLPNVAAELQAVQEIEGGTLLKDKDYVLRNVEQEFSQKSFTLVHIASHGHFSSDPKQTFLLTYDGKLTMDGLEKLIAPSRYRDQPLELLTLSACQTAAGDDRAALGLAGVAVKAGARSALASLWFINDQSSTLLISDFYRYLKQPGMSKAKALQQAQVKMIGDNRFGHPGYWSPFLLIGNWL
jgi:CHAT domain-containing protein